MNMRVRNGTEILARQGDNAKCASMKRIAKLQAARLGLAENTIAIFILFECLQAAGASQRECTSYEQTIDGWLEIVTHCRNIDEIPGGTDILENTTYLLLDSNTLGRVPSRLLNDSKPEPGLARLKALKVLDLSNNRLSQLGHETLAMNLLLERITLANNYFKRVPRDSLSRLPRLQHLDLTGNRIAALHNDTFNGLQSLTEVILADNRISVIESDVFVNLPNLLQLDLSSNNLTTIDEQIEPSWMSLQRLRLGGNPLHCDCNLLWLKKILNKKHSDSEQLRCETSPVRTARNKPWTELSIPHFACAPQLYLPTPGTVTSVQVKLGEKSTSFTCHMWSYPKQQVFWKREEKDLRFGISQSERKYEISISPFSNFSTTLYIKSLNVTDTGNYVCELSNDAGTVRGEFHLQVMDAQQTEGLAELIGSHGASFTTLIVSIFGALIIILIVISTVVYCWHFSRSSKAAQLGNAKQRAAACKLATSPSPLALSLAPSYEPIKSAEPAANAPDASNLAAMSPPPPMQYRQVTFDDAVMDNRPSPRDNQNHNHNYNHNHNHSFSPVAQSANGLLVQSDDYLDTSSVEMHKPCPIHGIMPGTLTASPRIRFPICVPSLSSSSDYVMLSAGAPASGDVQTLSASASQRLSLVVKPRHADTVAVAASDTSTSLTESPWSPHPEDYNSDNAITCNLQNGYIAL